MTLEILHFIFSSFWIWLGTVLLIGAFGTAIGGAIAAFRGR
jgi:hypothetical protein